MKRAPIRWWQRIVQKLAMTNFISSRFLAKFLHHIDAAVLRWSKGRISPTTLLAGLPVITLITTGAKSGKPRSVLLAGYPDGINFVLVASSFGSPNHPAWYYNLCANPAAEIILNGATKKYRARIVGRQEREKYWQIVMDYYPGYQAYQRRAGGREIPIFLLQPDK